MPQISLKISKNINIAQLNFSELFKNIHESFYIVPNIDLATLQSGVTQEEFSYFGLNNTFMTKMYLEVYWIENEQRLAIKPRLAEMLLKILEEFIAPQVEKQNLICIPRVRIANLGTLNQDYFISSRKTSSEK